MDRLERLRQGITPGQTVLEIGPYFNPIAPRAAGYRSTVLDVFATEQLRQRAAVDPHIPRERVAEIEEVDLVGSACDLADLTRARYGADHQFDWILSSHNIEHIPNPVRFLEQCAAVLRPGGVLRLAIPDKRFCFDHFRPLSETSEWLEACFENRTRPTPYQIYREESHRSTPAAGGGGWTPTRRSLSLYREWFGPDGRVPADYIDTHCWAFTPESFELIVRDTIAFGLVPLRIESVSATCGIELYVDLARPAAPVAVAEDDYYATRERLLRLCVEGEARPGERPAVQPSPPHSVPRRVLREARRVVRQIRSVGQAAAGR
ncbi:MAG: methyltransferase domain-containing protein [Planctomycetia bacterium]